MSTLQPLTAFLAAAMLRDMFYFLFCNKTILKGTRHKVHVLGLLPEQWGLLSYCALLQDYATAVEKGETRGVLIVLWYMFS